MNSSGEKYTSRKTANFPPDEMRKELQPATLNIDSGAPDRGIGRDTRPVRIKREDAQENIPPDPDPDDPVSP